MPKNLILTLGLIAALSTSQPSLAVSKNVAESFKILVGNHPTSARHVQVVPSDIDSDVYACVGTSHDNSKKSGQGYNVAKINIQRPDPETGETAVERHGKRGALKDNKWLRCVHTGPLKAGDIVEFLYKFSDYPKPRGATIHIRSTLSEERMLVSDLRGPEALADPGEPTQIHQRVSNSFAENGKHPKLVRQASIIHNDSDSESKAQLCVGYGNTIVKKPDTGSAEFTVEIGRTDPETGEIVVETRVLSDKLKNNKLRKCVTVDPVKAGDTLIVDAKLSKFPKLRDNAKVAGVAAGGDAFEIKTGIGPTRLLLSELLGPPKAPTGGGGTGGGGGGTGGGGGGVGDTSQVSAAEQKVISALSQMTAIGIGTRQRAGITWLIAHRYACANFQEKATIAAVYAQFVKDCGNRGVTGGGLTPSQLAAIVKFKRAKGITGLRWESGGRVIGEYYTPATDTVHATFKTIEAAVKWLEGQGRFR